MIDVDERAERAGAAARAQARMLVARMPRPTDARRLTPRRHLLAVAAGVVAVAGVVALLVAGDALTPVIDGVAPDPAAPVAVDGVLPAPEEGDVLAAYLDDGTAGVRHPPRWR